MSDSEEEESLRKAALATRLSGSEGLAPDPAAQFSVGPESATEASPTPQPPPTPQHPLDLLTRAKMSAPPTPPVSGAPFRGLPPPQHSSHRQTFAPDQPALLPLPTPPTPIMARFPIVVARVPVPVAMTPIGAAAAAAASVGLLRHHQPPLGTPLPMTAAISPLRPVSSVSGPHPGVLAPPTGPPPSLPPPPAPPLALTTPGHPRLANAFAGSPLMMQPMPRPPHPGGVNPTLGSHRPPPGFAAAPSPFHSPPLRPYGPLDPSSHAHGQPPTVHQMPFPPTGHAPRPPYQYPSGAPGYPTAYMPRPPAVVPTHIHPHHGSQPPLPPSAQNAAAAAAEDFISRGGKRSGVRSRSRSSSSYSSYSSYSSGGRGSRLRRTPVRARSPSVSLRSSSLSSRSRSGEGRGRGSGVRRDRARTPVSRSQSSTSATSSSVASSPTRPTRRTPRRRRPSGSASPSDVRPRRRPESRSASPATGRRRSTSNQRRHRTSMSPASPRRGPQRYGSGLVSPGRTRPYRRTEHGRKRSGEQKGNRLKDDDDRGNRPSGDRVEGDDDVITGNAFDGRTAERVPLENSDAMPKMAEAEKTKNFDADGDVDGKRERGIGRDGGGGGERGRWEGRSRQRNERRDGSNLPQRQNQHHQQIGRQPQDRHQWNQNRPHHHNPPIMHQQSYQNRTRRPLQRNNNFADQNFANNRSQPQHNFPPRQQSNYSHQQQEPHFQPQQLNQDHNQDRRRRLSQTNHRSGDTAVRSREFHPPPDYAAVSASTDVTVANVVTNSAIKPLMPASFGTNKDDAGKGSGRKLSVEKEHDPGRVATDWGKSRKLSNQQSRDQKSSPPRDQRNRNDHFRERRPQHGREAVNKTKVRERHDPNLVTRLSKLAGLDAAKASVGGRTRETGVEERKQAPSRKTAVEKAEVKEENVEKADASKREDKLLNDVRKGKDETEEQPEELDYDELIEWDDAGGDGDVERVEIPEDARRSTDGEKVMGEIETDEAKRRERKRQLIKQERKNEKEAERAAEGGKGKNEKEAADVSRRGGSEDDLDEEIKKRKEEFEALLRRVNSQVEAKIEKENSAELMEEREADEEAADARENRHRQERGRKERRKKSKKESTGREQRRRRQDDEKAAMASPTTKKKKKDRDDDRRSASKRRRDSTRVDRRDDDFRDEFRSDPREAEKRRGERGKIEHREANKRDVDNRRGDSVRNELDHRHGEVTRDARGELSVDEDGSKGRARSIVAGSKALVSDQLEFTVTIKHKTAMKTSESLQANSSSGSGGGRCEDGDLRGRNRDGASSKNRDSRTKGSDESGKAPRKHGRRSVERGRDKEDKRNKLKY